MKYVNLKGLARRARRLLDSGSPVRPGESKGVHEEVAVGSVVGLFACGGFATATASSIVVFFASIVGAYAGAVIGLLLWIDSADLPEDPVLPPATGLVRPQGERLRQ